MCGYVCVSVSKGVCDFSEVSYVGSSIFMCGSSDQSRNVKAVCVGLFVLDYLCKKLRVLFSVSFFRCSLGKKCLDCVDVPSER